MELFCRYFVSFVGPVFGFRVTTIVDPVVKSSSIFRSPSMVGAPQTSASTIPCTAEACAGIGRPGLTNDTKRSTRRVPSIRRQAISTIPSSRWLNPVVSRSMTVKLPDRRSPMSMSRGCHARVPQVWHESRLAQVCGSWRRRTVDIRNPRTPTELRYNARFARADLL